MSKIKQIVDFNTQHECRHSLNKIWKKSIENVEEYDVVITIKNEVYTKIWAAIEALVQK